MLEKNFKKDDTLFKNLQNIKGISNSSALSLCQQLGVSEFILYKELSKRKLNKLSSLLTNLKRSTNFLLIDRNLTLITKENIQKLIQLNTHRGRRIKYGYPAHGQRTSSNAKTAKKTKKFIKF